MIVENKKLQKHKAKIFSSIMKDKNLANAMFDAWEAPVGSTKKQRAKSIIKSISLAHRNYSRLNDGQGGNSNFSLWNYTGPTMNLPLDLSGGTKQLPTTNKSGQSGLFNTASTGNSSGQTILGATQTPTITRNKLVSGVDDLRGKFKNTVIDANNGVKTLSPLDPGYKPYSFEDLFPTKISSPSAPSGTNAVSNSIYGASLKSEPSIKTGGKDPVGTIHTFPDGTYTYVNQDGSVHTGKLGDNYVDQTGFVGPKLPTDSTSKTNNPIFDDTDTAYNYLDTLRKTYGDGSLETFFNSLDKSTQEYLRPAYEAVKKGVGKSTFAYQMLSDKKAFASLLKVPVEALKDLPDSGLLSDQLESIWRTTKKEYQLDSLLDQYTKLVNGAGDINTTLTQYIHGKDQYMGDVDALIDKASEISAKTDTSNPYVAQRLSNYTNYLYKLKDRQNTRYMNMLDQGVKQYNAKLTGLVNEYNMKLEAAKSDYQFGAARATEGYETRKTMLEELYTNIENRYSNFKDLADLQYKMVENASKLTTSVLEQKKLEAEINKINNETSGINYDDYEPSNIDSLLGIVTDKNTNTTSMTYLDPIEALRNTASGKQDPQNILNRFNLVTQEKVANEVGNGSMSSAIGSYDAVFNKYSTLMKERDDAQKAYDAIPDTEVQKKLAARAQLNDLDTQYNALSKTADGIESGIRQGLLNYMNKEGNITKIRKTIESLEKSKGASYEDWSGGKGWFTFAPSLQDDFAKYLWEYYQDGMNAYTTDSSGKRVSSPQDPFIGYKNDSDNKMKSTLAADMAAGIKLKLLARLYGQDQ
jgi:hypothetical protein